MTTTPTPPTTPPRGRPAGAYAANLTAAWDARHYQALMVLTYADRAPRLVTLDGQRAALDEGTYASRQSAKWRNVATDLLIASYSSMGDTTRFAAAATGQAASGNTNNKDAWDTYLHALLDAHEKARGPIAGLTRDPAPDNAPEGGVTVS